MADIIYFRGEVDGQTGEMKLQRIQEPFHENAAHLNLTIGKPSVEPKDPTLTVFYEPKKDRKDETH